MDDEYFRTWLADTLRWYLRRFPAESHLLHSAALDLSPGPGELDLRDRSRVPCHVTASAIVEREQQVVLVQHRSLDRWLQPGGHLRGGETPWDGAMREVEEETGLRASPGLSGAALPRPLDIDLHEIPANRSKGELAHWHLDMRFLLHTRAESRERVDAAPAEIGDVCWLAMEVIAQGGREVREMHLDPSLTRAIAKARIACRRRQ